MSFSVILPTLNEKGHIINLIENISDVFKKQNLEYEILVVDDSSNDGTDKIVKDYQKSNNFLKLISRLSLKKNLANSINDGIKASKFENIIWMDADFQHPPKYINKFIELSGSYDVVIASRFLKESDRYFNNQVLKKEINENQSYLFNKICKYFLYKDLTDFTSGFICIKKKIFDNFELKGFYGDYFVSLISHIKKNNYSIIEIPFKDELRKSGLSKTIVNVNPKYIYTCTRYAITLISNILKKLINI
mgnify:CR=1 FL=1